MAQGVTALDVDQFDKAINYFTQVIKLRPKSSLGYLCRGVALSAEGKKDQAREDFQTVLRLVSPSTPVGKDAQNRMNLLTP
jgi:Flp pilus assembly protein TadD